LKTTTVHRCRLAAATGLLALIAACSNAPKTVAMGSMDEAPLKDADTSCNATCLEDLMQKYLDALAARDPSAAPVTDDVIFSENGVIQPFGDASWKTMDKRGSYWLPMTDEASGQAAVLTVMYERGDWELTALRIKARSGRIAEAEQMIVRRTGDGGSGSAGGATIVNRPQESPDPRLLAPVPPEERVSRAELVSIADSYFEGIDTATDSSITPFWDDCQRRENGTITANNPAAAPGSMANLACKQQFDTGFQIIVTDIRDRRIWVADTERQLVFAFGFFDHSGVGSPETTTGTFAKPFTFQIAEAFKVRDGKIQQIEAYLYSVPDYRLRTDFDRLYEAKGFTPNNGNQP
jgi:ketosteroid isomerase-like protein